MTSRTKRHRYRAYPTGGQTRAAARLFGCVRLVYNRFLEQRDQLYAEGRHRDVAMSDTAKAVTTQLKRQPDYEFLAEVSAVPLQQSTEDARKAYTNWYASMSGKRKGPKVGKPRFKRRASRQAARFTANARFNVRTEPGCKWGWVRLPGIGHVKFALSRDLPSDPSSVTLIREADGTWHVSFVVQVPAELEQPAAHPSRVASLDVGVGDDLAAVVYSDGTREKVDNPRHLRSRARKVRKANKALSRKVKGSANWRKQQAKLAKAHRQAADARRDHHRKLARRLTVDNQAVCRETLSLRGMGRTRLARSVYDAGIGTLFQLLDEEAENQGRHVAAANQWSPTTQTCSVCGAPGGKKPLSVRVWTCQGCGATLDRDFNAAVNVLVAAGLAETRNACGGDVRHTLACADPNEAGTHRTDRTETRAAAQESPTFRWGRKSTTHDIIQAICRIAEHHGAWLISDEIYRDLTHPHSEREFTTPVSIAPERTIVTTGLSKNLALGGWRTGLVRYPDTDQGHQLRDTALTHASELWSSPTGPAQQAAAHAFNEPAEVTERIAVSRTLHANATNAVAQVFRDAGADVPASHGAFYCYPDFGPVKDVLIGRHNIRTAADLARHLLAEYGVATLPADVFTDRTTWSVRVAVPLAYGANDVQRHTMLNFADNPMGAPHFADAVEQTRDALTRFVDG